VSSFEHRDGPLQHDRAGIQLACHEVHGDSADLHAVIEGLALRVGHLETMAAMRMDVEDSRWGYASISGRRQCALKPGKAYEANVASLQLARKCSIELVARGPAAMADTSGLDSCGPGPFQTAGIFDVRITTAIVAFKRPLPIASISDCRLEPRPEIRTPCRRFTRGLCK
jgi:hypothetical protein